MPRPPPITQADIDRLILPNNNREQMNDGGCTGLSLRAGLETPTWLVRGSTGGTLRKVIGDPRTMPLEVARRIATEARWWHSEGNVVDDAWIADAQRRHGIVAPEPEVYVEPEGPWTWAQAAEAHLRWMIRKGRSPVTVAANRKSLLKTLWSLRDVLITDITLEDVQDEVDRLHLSTPALASHAVKAARPFSRWFSIGPQRLKAGTEVHVLQDLVIPGTKRSRSGSFFAPINPVSIQLVAKTVAICRSGILNAVTSRAVEATILTGLRRSAVVSARHADIVDGVWTVRPEVLKRRVPIKVKLTPRLLELMQSDDSTWVFPQPRKPKSGPPTHLGDSAVGRATWELPDVPSASECKMRMMLFLRDELLDERGEPRTDLLVDAGAAARDGGDDHIIHTGQTAAAHREQMVDLWGKELEPWIEKAMPEIDRDAIWKEVLKKRPSGAE